MKLYTFTAIGAGTFPIDMLRHGACWPYDSQDSGQITSFSPVKREVRLESIRLPDVGRWGSFGWSINDIRKT